MVQAAVPYHRVAIASPLAKPEERLRALNNLGQALRMASRPEEALTARSDGVPQLAHSRMAAEGENSPHGRLCCGCAVLLYMSRPPPPPPRVVATPRRHHSLLPPPPSLLTPCCPPPPAHARKAFEQARLADPTSTLCWANVLVVRRSLCRWDDLPQLVRQVVRRVSEQIDSPPFEPPALLPFEHLLTRVSAPWRLRAARRHSEQWDGLTVPRDVATLGQRLPSLARRVACGGALWYRWRLFVA